MPQPRTATVDVNLVAVEIPLRPTVGPQVKTITRLLVSFLLLFSLIKIQPEANVEPVFMSI